MASGLEVGSPQGYAYLLSADGAGIRRDQCTICRFAELGNEGGRMKERFRSLQRTQASSFGSRCKRSIPRISLCDLAKRSGSLMGQAGQYVDKY